MREQEDANFNEPGNSVKPIVLTEEQKELYDEFYSNLASSVEIDAFIDGEKRAAIITTERLCKWVRLTPCLRKINSLI